MYTKYKKYIMKGVKMKTKTIVIANQKGGAGKSTTAISMATILREKGFKTLFIDTDLQCNASDTYGAEIEGVATLSDVILSEKTIPAIQAIQKTEYGDMIPGDPLLRNADTILGADHMNGTFRLADKLKELKNETDYDYIIIDTNPAINLTLYSSLVAADELIATVTADRYAIQGLVQLQDSLDAVRLRNNPNIKTMGILITRFAPQTILAKGIQKELHQIAENLGTELFDTTIRECNKVKEAQSYQMPLIKFAPTCTSYIDYESFVDEYLKLEDKNNGIEK